MAIAESVEPLAEPHFGEHRTQEIYELNEKLRAIETLDNIKFAVQGINRRNAINLKPAFYLIVYNHKRGTVEVVSKFNPLRDAADYDAEEARISASRGDDETVVLVEAEQVGSIEKAFPNYFGDVQVFSTTLKNLTQGERAREFTMPAQYRAPPAPADKPISHGWLRPGGHRRWND